MIGATGLFFIIFVIFQVIGEAVPISSSGHLLLAIKFFEKSGSLPAFFDDFLHGPMILIIMMYFYQSWWSPFTLLCRVLKKYIACGFVFDRLRDSEKKIITLFFKISSMVVLADSVTAVLYVFIIKKLKHCPLLGSDWMLLAGFVITMIMLFLSQRENHQRLLTHRIALILGAVQGLTLLPGISRFATTFVAGRLLGVSARRSLQFSFLMFFPLITAAFFINGLPAVLTTAPGLLAPSKLLFYGLATIIAYFIFSWACRLALSNRLWWFGFYMIVPILVTVGLLVW